ncbi:MAG: SDR family NAD(P)-dependent oxidoreductase [Rhodospirillales bacterium]
MTPTADRRLFCFGLGYTARRLAARLAAQGWGIAGTARRPAAAATPDGWPLYRFDRGHPLDPAALAGATHVLVSVPPDEAGDPVIDAHGGDLAAPGTIEWIGYLSTTGVYGDRGGGWVSEDDAPAPQTERARRRLAAEAAWRALRPPAHVFRLAGIYGPGRSAIDTLRAGTARRIVKPGHAVSRIHVEDIAAVLAASIARPRPGAVYNVCDDAPAPPAEVIGHAAALLGLPAPPEEPFDPATLSPMSASFFAENRRVSNDLIKRELGIVLRYPTYRDGLAALLAEP